MVISDTLSSVHIHVLFKRFVCEGRLSEARELRCKVRPTRTQGHRLLTATQSSASLYHWPACLSHLISNLHLWVAQPPPPSLTLDPLHLRHCALLCLNRHPVITL